MPGLRPSRTSPDYLAAEMTAGKNGGYSPSEVALIMFHNLGGILQPGKESIIRQWMILSRRILAHRGRIYAALIGPGITQ